MITQLAVYQYSMYHFKTRGMYWFVVGLYTTCHLLPEPENYSEYIMNQRTCEKMACKIPGVTCSLQVTHHSKNACSFWMMINPYYIKCWFGNQPDKKHTGLGLPCCNTGRIEAAFLLALAALATAALRKDDGRGHCGPTVEPVETRSSTELVCFYWYFILAPSSCFLFESFTR